MTPTQNVPEDRIQIGQLRSAYGLNGWLWGVFQYRTHEQYV